MCEIGGKHDLVVKVNLEELGGLRSASTPPSLWANYTGIAFQDWEQSVAYRKVHVTLSHVADIKFHLHFIWIASNLCSKHYSRCRDGECKLLLPASLHGPMHSSAKSRHLAQNTPGDYVTLPLHIDTAHEAEPCAHKQVEQLMAEEQLIALGYVSMLGTKKKASNHHYQGGKTASRHSSAPPQQPHWLCQAPGPWSAAAGAATYEGRHIQPQAAEPTQLTFQRACNCCITKPQHSSFCHTS